MMMLEKNNYGKDVQNFWFTRNFLRTCTRNIKNWWRMGSQTRDMQQVLISILPCKMVDLNLFQIKVRCLRDCKKSVSAGVEQKKGNGRVHELILRRANGGQRVYQCFTLYLQLCCKDRSGSLWWKRIRCSNWVVVGNAWKPCFCDVLWACRTVELFVFTLSLANWDQAHLGVTCFSDWQGQRSEFW